MIPKFLLFFALYFSSCGSTVEDTPKRDYASFHTEALAYCKKQDFNQEYYFLVDLSLHSGRNRFFVYDFQSGKITNEGLVTHGSCDVLTSNDSKWETVKFNNANNSHCSAKGKYKIGKRDYSAWGIKVKYWLKGLEKTNSNAEQRVVVLHSWTAVANTEIYPKYSPLSWGCPAVSDEFMTLLDSRLQKSNKPVLLWIVE